MARPFGTKNIKTPEELLELFEQYKSEVKDNPRFKTQFVGKDGNMVKEPLERPLTMEGFENHCFMIGKINDLKDYFSNKEQRYSDFAPICSRIREIIRQDQIEGGMVGQYNPSITQRLNNLKEQTETVNTNLNLNILNIDPLDDSSDNQPQTNSKP